MTQPSNQTSQTAVGRAAIGAPPNRFERLACEADLEQLSSSDLADELATQKIPTQFFDDTTRSVLQKNNSPDIPFAYSLNPYRGCEHGCAYCYARPGHENLGWNAGIDFETQILVKQDAPAILRDELNHSNWRGELIVISGFTDCYQPAERVYQITRQCIEVFNEAHQAFSIITKNALVARDIDLLAQAAAENRTRVNMSVTTLDAELGRRLEPRTATPQARLRTIERLTSAGIPVSVMMSPIIPGLNDHEIPELLKAARDAGAVAAYSQMLRLPLSVAPVFMDWLSANYPSKADLVESRIRGSRQGQLNNAQFHDRMRGQGPYADNIRKTFRVFADKLGFTDMPPLDTTLFRPPKDRNGQGRLFA